jgi:error-prone DNA polymerase
VQAPGWRELIDLAGQLAGFPRHVSQHVGGMVLSAGPLAEVVPLEPAAMPGRWLIQWDKDAVADARLVKVDLLALGMLSVVDECLALVEDRHGRRPDFSRLGYADPAVYARLSAADTVGVFQLESRAQMQTLPLTQPRTLDDLAAQVAIVRPGPIQGGAFRPFLEARRRLLAGERVRVRYDHPLLQPVLEETLGVILYQEQVLQVAMAVAGYTAGQAEALRRALSRRRAREAVAVHWPRFRDGAAARGVPEGVARRIFQKLLDFAAYGFPKSHALAFARLAYESAWLRHRYPAEYYCALFNHQPMGFYPPAVLVGDARRHGVTILGPDLNRSAVRATVEGDDRVRLGLASVRGLGLATAAAVVAERAARGPFCSLFDLRQRTGLAPVVVERLILAGACDGFGLERRELLWQLGLLAGGAAWGRGFGRPGGRAGRQGLPRQGALPLPVAQDMVALRPLAAWERLVAEQATLGLSPTLHPLALLRPHLGEGVQSSRHVERWPDGARVRLAGLVVSRQRPESARGVLFVLLEDEAGLVNVVVSPALYARQRVVLRGEPFLVVEGVVQRRGGGSGAGASVSVRAQAVAPLRLPVPFPGDGLRLAMRERR